MIIGEAFKESNFHGQQEDSYDYLFKKQPKAVRQQRKEEKKQGIAGPKKRNGLRGFGQKIAQLKQNRQENKPAKKRLIAGNFGLFDKNKKRQANRIPPVAVPEADPLEAEAPIDLPVVQEPVSIPDAPIEEQTSVAAEDIPAIPQAEDNPNPAGEEEQPKQDPETSDSYDEKDAKDPAGTETKKKDKDSKAGGGGLCPVFGWTCLVVTVLIVAVVAHSAGKGDQPAHELINAS